MNCFHLSIHLQLAASLKQLWGRAPCGVGFPGGSEVKNLSARQETWVQFLGWQDPLEKEKATYSSILAWEIPWTEEPGRLLTARSYSQRVRCDLATKQQQDYHVEHPLPMQTQESPPSPSCSSPASLSCSPHGAPETSAVPPHAPQVTLGDAVLLTCIVLLMLSVVWWWASTLCTKPVTSSLSSIYSVMFIKCLHHLSGTLPTLRLQQWI